MDWATLRRCPPRVKEALRTRSFSAVRQTFALGRPLSSSLPDNGHLPPMAASEKAGRPEGVDCASSPTVTVPQVSSAFLTDELHRQLRDPHLTFRSKDWAPAIGLFC